MWLSNQEIGLRIRQIRDAGRLSQGELAERIGLAGGQAQVSKWERGLNRPSEQFLQRIATVGGVSVSVFAASGGAPESTAGPFDLSPALSLIAAAQKPGAFHSFGGPPTHHDIQWWLYARLYEQFDKSAFDVDTLIANLHELDRFRDDSLRMQHASNPEAAKPRNSSSGTRNR
jgi:transcriptional regulator with XRE-family HTH domain